MIAEEKLQAAARAVHEVLKGKGTWNSASKEERSGARHLVRVMLVAANFDVLEQNGESQIQSVIGASELDSTITDVSVTESPQEQSDIGSLKDAPVPVNLKPFNGADKTLLEPPQRSRLQLRRK